jgi:hypothetical protein
VGGARGRNYYRKEGKSEKSWKFGRYFIVEKNNIIFLGLLVFTHSLSSSDRNRVKMET